MTTLTASPGTTVPADIDRFFADNEARIRDELLASRVGGNHWSHGILADPHFCTAMALIILQVPEARLASMKRDN